MHSPHRSGSAAWMADRGRSPNLAAAPGKRHPRALGRRVDSLAEVFAIDPGYPATFRRSCGAPGAAAADRPRVAPGSILQPLMSSSSRPAPAISVPASVATYWSSSGCGRIFSASIPRRQGRGARTAQLATANSLLVKGHGEHAPVDLCLQPQCCHVSLTPGC